MNTRTCASFFILTVLLFISCGNNKVKLPIETSLGNLVKIEQKDMIKTNKKIITPKPEELLYLLTFEGKNEIIYEGELQYDGPYRLLIVDPKGAQFNPEFAGTITEDGTVSKEKWLMTGSVEFLTGEPVFKEKAVLPEGKLALIYLVPKKASGLTLADGDKRYRIK